MHIYTKFCFISNIKNKSPKHDVHVQAGTTVVVGLVDQSWGTDMSHGMTKPTKLACAQRRLRSDWASESSLCARRVAKNPSFLHADSEDSDQTWRMPRLIWVFAGRTTILLFLSCRGSFVCWLVSGWCLLGCSHAAVSMSCHTVHFTICIERIFVTRQANLCLRAFRHDKF